MQWDSMGMQHIPIPRIICFFELDKQKNAHETLHSTSRVHFLILFLQRQRLFQVVDVLLDPPEKGTGL